MPGMIYAASFELLACSTWRRSRYTRMNVEVPPRSLLTISSFGLKLSIVLIVFVFKRRASSALLMFNVITFPLMVQVPRTVPVAPWPSVLLMNPLCQNLRHKRSVAAE